MVTRRSFLLGIGCTGLLAIGWPVARGSAQPAAFFYDDLESFRQAWEALQNGAEPRQALARYLDTGSAGLQAYARIYGVTADRMVERVLIHHDEYARLAHARSQIESFEPNVRHAIERVHELAPHTRRVPVYYFVGAMGHGATPRELNPYGGEESLALLIPIEHALSSVSLALLVAHELTHVSQIGLQGLDEYRSIYRHPERSTHLAYAVREGAADMVASVATGHTQPRFDYVRVHEADLWRDFEPLLHEQVTPATGWFGGPRDPEALRPHALGYAIGHAMCAAYYESSGGGRAALNDVLRAVTPEQFDRIAMPYRARFSGQQPRP